MKVEIKKHRMFKNDDWKVYFGIGFETSEWVNAYIISISLGFWSIIIRWK